MAALASVVVVRAWRGERFLAEGRAAQRRGHFDAASAAFLVASGYGNADAAAERARLQMLRDDWAGARASLRGAKALAPLRALPYVLQAQLDMNSPGPLDDAREKRIVDSCRTAAASEPHLAWVKRECEIIMRSMAERGRTSK